MYIARNLTQSKHSIGAANWQALIGERKLRRTQQTLSLFLTDQLTIEFVTASKVWDFWWLLWLRKYQCGIHKLRQDILEYGQIIEINILREEVVLRFTGNHCTGPPEFWLGPKLINNETDTCSSSPHKILRATSVLNRQFLTRQMFTGTICSRN